jgi:hypothetical protein
VTAVAPLAATVTHADLVTAAERWLRRKHPVVLVDVHSATTNEQPDAIGWMNNGTSTLIECKASRSDFARDAKKWFRRAPELGIGACRYFLTPDSLLEGLFVPDGWGVLYTTARGGIRVVRQSRAFLSFNQACEKALLVGAVRRATEGWGRRTFGEIAPALAPDGDPHPTASKTIRELRSTVQQLREELRAARIGHPISGGRDG